ncbi:hypothetical protein SDC9_130193 [bioreactor metagenome]|uniref:Uncharacterized protein n=1 Tax=bioreactor metagenome TaxID=1076179 RepID=A0A645D0T5_9ZZZZ
MHAAGHEIVPRAFRRALGKNRGFDFHKVLLVKVFPRDERDLMPHEQVLLHAGTAKVEIAVLKSQQFVCTAIVADVERRRFALAQNLEFADDDFQLTGRHVCVDHVAGAENEFALDRKHEFRTDCAGAIEIFLAQNRGIEHHLHQPRAVTQLHKHQCAEVAPNVCPAHQGNFFTCVRFGKICAVVCSLPAA